jgi:hypothetical protein
MFQHPAGRRDPVRVMAVERVVRLGAAMVPAVVVVHPVLMDLRTL